MGSSLTSFALGVWLFEHTAKVLEFAGLIMSGLLPMALVSPWAGAIADRCDKRYVILVADSVAAATTFVLIVLLWQGGLQIWRLYAINLVVSITRVFRAPAYLALATSLLSTGQIPRASGLMGVSADLVAICAPTVAAALMVAAGLPCIAIIDIVAFCIGTMLLLKVFSALASPAAQSLASVDSSRIGSFAYFVESFLFFRRHRLMSGLLCYAALQASLIALVTTLLTPLILSNHSVGTLGLIMTIGGLGGLLGSGYLVMVGPRRGLMVGLLICDGVVSACVLVAGLHNSAIVYAGCSFLACAAASAAYGLSGALWMRKVPVGQQGRIFALIGMVVMLAAPLVVVAGGFAADRIFEPALASGSVLAANATALLGAGKGKGLALVFVLSGLIGLALSLAALGHTRLRNIDLLVPDARPCTPAPV